MIDSVKNEVKKLLDNDNSGHGMDHIDRVLRLSLKFAEKEKADKDIVSLIALLHDVDDYKLFGKENAENLTNAKRIMNDLKIDKNIQEKVLNELKRIGYSKSLNGVRPITLEGKIVSDADMCDALGANGILRTYAFSIKNNQLFFNKDVFPVDNLTIDKYTVGPGICHMFEKILRLKGLMLTNSGKEEAKKRNKIVVDFLYNFFEEESAPEWKEYLDNYLKK